MLLMSQALHQHYPDRRFANTFADVFADTPNLEFNTPVLGDVQLESLFENLRLSLYINRLYPDL
jgi:hypothetical protein